MFIRIKLIEFIKCINYSCNTMRKTSQWSWYGRRFPASAFLLCIANYFSCCFRTVKIPLIPFKPIGILLMSTASSATFSAFQISSSEKLSVTSTFLRTEEFKHIGFWVTTENHSYMRSCEKSLAFILFILTVPTSGLRRPNIIFNNVDFPLPENPTMAHSSCGRICREISFNTFWFRLWL